MHTQNAELHLRNCMARWHGPIFYECIFTIPGSNYSSNSKIPASRFLNNDADLDMQLRLIYHLRLRLYSDDDKNILIQDDELFSLTS